MACSSSPIKGIEALIGSMAEDNLAVDAPRILAQGDGGCDGGTHVKMSLSPLVRGRRRYAFKPFSASRYHCRRSRSSVDMSRQRRATRTRRPGFDDEYGAFGAALAFTKPRNCEATAYDYSVLRHHRIHIQYFFEVVASHRR